MKRVYKILSLTAIGLVGVLLGTNLKNASNVKAEETPTIHVMSCNLAQDLQNNETLKAIGVGIMNREQPDIIGTQEQAPGWTTTLDAELDGYTGIFQYRGGSIAPLEGSGIYFKTDRFHLKGKGTFWFGESGTEWTEGHTASEWGACFARVCTYVLLNDLETGKDIGFFNAHLEYNHAYGSMAAATESSNTKLCRVNSVDQMIRHINALNVPCFLTGDFNFWRSIDTDAFDHLTEVMTDSYDYMKDKGGDTGYTFHGNCGHDDDVENNYPHTPIDYNLCTKDDFIPTTYTIYKEDLEYGVTPKANCYSDHFYISTVYEYACEYPGAGEQQIDNYVLEAEHGIITGTSSSQPAGEPMVGTRNSSNSRPTSNGACVMNFATAGNNITWRFNISKEVKDVKIGVWFAPSTSSAKTADKFSFTLNGKEIGWETTDLPGYPGSDKWYDWTKLTTSAVTFPEGSIELVLTNTAGYYGNFDSIEIPFNTKLLVTDYVDTKEYNELTIEAEAQMPSEGQPQSGETTFLVFNSGCSRGACIGNWYSGTTATNYTINASKAFTGKITVFASNFMGLTDPNGQGGIYPIFNSAKVNFDESSWPSISGGYYSWQELHLSNLNFKQGDNVLRIEGWDSNHNIDKFVVSFTEDVTVTYDDKLENFVKNDLHMEDYTENKGWCKDTEHHYYSTAKTSYNALTSENKEIFYKIKKFEPAYLRFQAWASANGDTFSGTSLSSMTSYAQVLNINSTTTIAILVSSVSAIAIIVLAIKKRKRHE